jgi:prepilin-type N-terminal cleavage/methylation domain-containing protein
VTSRRRGLTLLELLVTVTLVALATSVVSLRISASGERSRLREAATTLRQMDERARLFAQTLGPIDLILDRDHRTLELRRTETGERLRRSQLPGEIRARLGAPRDVRIIRYDRWGTSSDYDVVLTSGGEQTRWKQLGSTGWILQDDGEGG